MSMGDTRKQEIREKLPLPREEATRRISSLMTEIKYDGRTAPGKASREARRKVWELAHIRTWVEDNKEELDQFTGTQSEKEWLLDRLAEATYFLQFVDTVVHIVVDQKNPTLFRVFDEAVDCITTLIDDKYFVDKTHEDVGDDYHRAEVTITALANHCEVTLLSESEYMDPYEHAFVNGEPPPQYFS